MSEINLIHEERWVTDYECLIVSIRCVNNKDWSFYVELPERVCKGDLFESFWLEDKLEHYQEFSYIPHDLTTIHPEIKTPFPLCFYNKLGYLKNDRRIQWGCDFYPGQHDLEEIKKDAFWLAGKLLDLVVKSRHELLNAIEAD